MRAVVSLFALALLCGCYSPVGMPIGPGADPDAIPTSTTLPADVAAAEARVQHVLNDLGFARSDRTWRRRLSADANWAFCPPLRFEDDDTYKTAFVESERVTVAPDITPVDGGARVTIAPRFTGVYRLPRGTVERGCRSFGVFETRFFDALGDAGAAQPARTRT